MDENELKNDVRGLCAAGQSPKPSRNHIGFISVGLKSIFEISNHEVFKFGIYKIRPFISDLPHKDTLLAETTSCNCKRLKILSEDLSRCQLPRIH
jgi:hypothetical protein